MISSVGQTDERRVGNLRDWIGGICRQFGAATGWKLIFTGVNEQNRHSIESELATSPNCCWHTEIRSGLVRTGFLHIELPNDCRDDRSFLTICKLAEIVARMLNELSAVNESLECRTKEFATLVDIGLSVPNEDYLLDALRQLLRASIQLTDFRAAAFFLLDPAENVLNLRICDQLDARQIPTTSRDLASMPPDHDVLIKGTKLLLRADAAEDDQWLPMGMSIGLGVAVQSETGPIGTLWAFDRRVRSVSERETHVLESLCAQIATILERVVLLRESKTQHRLQRELEVVSETQIDDQHGQLPANVGFEAASRCRSRYELGGDLCELIPITEHHTAVCIGDASGDSIPAAIVMTAVRGALRALISGDVEDTLQTERILARVNQSLHSITPAHQFMSFLYGILDTSAMTFTYSNAGHPTPFHIRDGRIDTLISHGLLLGVSDTATYEHSVLPLALNDTLVLFSDGIVEAMNKNREMFRGDGIVDSIQRCVDDTPKTLLESIWNDFEAHSLGGSDPDDRTLLVIKLASR